MANIIDELIGFFAPGAGFKRVANRARMLSMETQVRKYEGARDGRRHSSYIANGNPSVNDVIIKDQKKLVARSRELTINNGFAKKAVFEIANNVVGSGILATPYVVDKIENGKIKQTKNKKNITQALQAAFNSWAEDVSCDHNGDFNFYGIQHLVVRTIATSGEALIVRRSVKQDVNKYGFQILVLEGEYIDQSKNAEQDKDGGFTYYGIKYDKNFKRSGFWLFDRHPSDSKAKSTFYKIEDVIHVFDVERTGQNRGVPFSASTILTQKDLSDYMDAELLAKKGAACFTAFVQKAENPDGEEAENELENLEPGIIQYLQPGETIQFPNLPQNPGLNEFTKVQQRSIAAGYLMPYETLTGDFSNVNFSSGRLGQLGFQKQIAYWQYLMFVPRFCDKVFAWFVSGYKIAQTLDATIEIKAKWTPPRREMIDPGKEVTAMKNEVRAGFSSWSEKVRENGYDPEQVLEEMKADQQKFIDAGLMPDWTQFFELTAKQKMNAAKPDTPKKADE